MALARTSSFNTYRNMRFPSSIGSTTFKWLPILFPFQLRWFLPEETTYTLQTYVWMKFVLTTKLHFTGKKETLYSGRISFLEKSFRLSPFCYWHIQLLCYLVNNTCFSFSPPIAMVVTVLLFLAHNIHLHTISLKYIIFVFNTNIPRLNYINVYTIS